MPVLILHKVLMFIDAECRRNAEIGVSTHVLHTRAGVWVRHAVSGLSLHPTALLRLSRSMLNANAGQSSPSNNSVLRKFSIGDDAGS